MFLLNGQIPGSKISRLQKISVRAGNRYIGGCFFSAVMLFSLLIFGSGPNAGAAQALAEAGLPVVVIDPGHGGNDSGAQGPDGTQEKTVTLTLARLIADQLETRCRVVLTRSDDYRLDIAGRTAVANQSRAEIFISLHTGASFSRSISGSTVYYHRQFIESALTAESKTPKSLLDSSQPQTPDTKVQGAPLLVLEGADMPAVVIEIGNLSNPNEEKILGDSKVLAGFAQAIADGVDTFFTEKAK
jgi:N-acetylmuramoyl-L-alanine amidase